MRRRLLIALALTAMLVAVLVGATSGSAARQATTVTVDYATSFGNFGRDSYVYVAMEKGTSSRRGSRSGSSPGRLGRQHQARCRGPARLHARRHRGADGHPGERGVAGADSRGRPPEHDVGALHAPGVRDHHGQGARGETLADSPASTVRVLFPLYAKKAGIDASKITWRDAAPPRCPPCSPRSRSTGSASSAWVSSSRVRRAASRSARSSTRRSWPARDRGRRLRREDPVESGRGTCLHACAAARAPLRARQPR